jgi:hypothetical protein
LSSSSLTGGNFRDAAFNEGIIIDLTNMTHLIGVDFKYAVCKFIRISCANVDPDKLIPLTANEFLCRYQESYSACCAKGSPVFDEIVRYICCVRGPEVAEQKVLEFLSQQIIWKNETALEAMKNMVRDLSLQQQMLINGFTPAGIEPRGLFQVSLMHMHMNLFTTSDLHRVMLDVIAIQKLDIMQELCANELFSSTNKIISIKIKAIETLLSTLLSTDNKSMMLQLTLYYVKFINPSAHVFSKLYMITNLSETDFQKVYEQALPFSQIKVSRLSPALNNNVSFFHREESDDDVDYDPPSTQMTRPPSAELGDQ